ncbi:MAG: DUF116 domain-containing protein [Desulfovibrio sp.]|uniref:DUF116 domain-containing protein n=1 Tax=Desulfovibrio sp. 7SRBS1 TaxID=3378064 RepID=UPI003B3CEEB0
MSKPIRPVIINPDLEDEAGSSRKRVFIGLTMATSSLVCLALLLLWIVPFIGLRQIHPTAPWILGVIITALVAIVGWASIGLVLSVWGLNIPFSRRMRGLTIKLFLPLMTMLGRMVGLSKQQVRSSFIKVNNELVDRVGATYTSDQILLLLPHCLQRSTCAYRLTYNVNNCKRCGKCPIGGLLELSDKYGISMAIATGGTIARRIVVQKRPRLILAVACERDLSSGIQDTYPIPVYGVLNERPHGPCLDTLVNLNNLEAAIRRFLSAQQLEQIDAACSQKLNEAPIKVADDS